MSAPFLFDQQQICACEVTILCEERINCMHDYLTIGPYCTLYQLAVKYIRDKINCFEASIDVYNQNSELVLKNVTEAIFRCKIK